MSTKIQISENQIKSFLAEYEAKTISTISGMEFETEGEKQAYIDGLKIAQSNMNQFMEFVITRANYNYDSEVEGE